MPEGNMQSLTPQKDFNDGGTQNDQSGFLHFHFFRGIQAPNLLLVQFGGVSILLPHVL